MGDKSCILEVKEVKPEKTKFFYTINNVGFILRNMPYYLISSAEIETLENEEIHFIGKVKFPSTSQCFVDMSQVLKSIENALDVTVTAGKGNVLVRKHEITFPGMLLPNMNIGLRVRTFEEKWFDDEKLIKDFLIAPGILTSQSCVKLIIRGFQSIFSNNEQTLLVINGEFIAWSLKQ